MRTRANKLSKENQKIFKDFLTYLKLEKGVKKNTELRYYFCLLRLQKFLSKPFNKVTDKELKDCILKVKEFNEWSPRTKDTVLFSAKTFFKWLDKDVSWIKRQREHELQKLPEDLITEEEALLMIKTADHIRDKALLAMLCESGCRIGELLNLRVKDIVFDDLGGTALLRGKTGERKVRLVFSVPYLKAWIEKHPFGRDAPIWVSISNNSKEKVMDYNRVNHLLKELAKKCNIKKPVNPHQFRHSRASFLAKFLTESQLKQYFGWTQGSDMAQVYVHMSGRDVDDALLSKVFGLKKIEEKGVTKLLHRFCLRCKTSNQAEHSFCQQCGFPLEAGATEDYEKKIKARQLEYEEIISRLRKVERVVLPAKH